MSVQYLYNSADGMELIFCKGTALSYPLHNHISVLTAGLVLHGTLIFTADGAARVCEAGACFLAPPYLPHQIEASEPYTLLTVCIPKRCLQTDSQDVLRAKLCRLITGSGVPLKDEQAARLSEAIAAFRAAPARPGPSWVEQARARLEQCPEEALRVTDLARAEYISPYYFIRCFRQYVGLTPHQFQTQNRVRMGQRLLRMRASSTEAALAAGFCDQSHFIRQFERQVRLTPTAYQRACRVLP